MADSETVNVLPGSMIDGEFRHSRVPFNAVILCKVLSRGKTNGF